MRAVATSLLRLEGAPVADVMRAGWWASGVTFTRFYLRDLVPQIAQIARSGPIAGVEMLKKCYIPSRKLTFLVNFPHY